MLTKETLFDRTHVPKIFKPNKPLDRGEQFVFVGQERDGTLLFTWEDSSPTSEGAGNLVTYIGVYNPYKKIIRAVFVHEQKSTIVNATINQGHTFIGFVTHEYVEQTGPQGKLLKQGVYRAFIAEIEPQNRVFYLNLEREAFIKLQFLYGYYRQQSTASTREDHLLVCLHQESIGVYHLPLARVGEEGVIMNGEPKKEQLFHRRFSWLQWDAASQRLYLLHFLKSGKNQRGHTQHQPYLKCFQLSQQEGSTAGGTFGKKEKQLVLDMPLDLPIPYIKDSVASSYLPIGPHQVIPDASINLQVLSQPSGALCVCYQHNTKSVISNVSSSENLNLQYSVCVVQKERVLHCQTYGIPGTTISNTRLFFSWIDGYLLVHLPDQFTHLLCVGVEYDLGMHIFAYHTQESEKTSITLPSTLLRYPSPEKSGHYSTGLCYFDLSLGEAFHCTVSEESMVQLFESCQDLHTRVAILHYSVVQTRNLALTKKLCESMCADPTDLDNVCLLEEILLGNTYSQLRIQVFAIDKNLLQFLPYTENMCFSFNTNISQRGERVCGLTYTQLPEITLLRDKGESREPSDFWGLLAGYLNKPVSTNHRFQPSSPQSDSETELQISPDPLVKRPTQDSSPSIFQKLKNAFSREGGASTQPGSEGAKAQAGNLMRPVSRVDAILGRAPAFLAKDDEVFMRSSRYFSKTLEHLSIHLIEHNKQVSRTKIRNVAEEYVKCQMISSRLLCHMIWSIVMPGQEDDGQLGRRGSPEEAGLCKMMDRYYMAVKQLGFPLPSGFPLYHTSLGFRCHPTKTFLEFVEQGVYSLTPDFVLQLLHDTDGDEALTDLKWLLISRLDQSEAVQCLRQWRHPGAMQCVAQHYAESVVTKQGGWEMVEKGRLKPGQAPAWTQGDIGGEMLPPAITFIKYLQKKDHGLHSGGSSGGLELDTEYLKQASMVYLSVPQVPH